MKSSILMICSFFLIAPLICVGLVSCHQDLAPTKSDTEVQDGSDDVVQPLSEDEYRIEIAAIAVELVAIVNGLDQVLINPEIENPDWTTTGISEPITKSNTEPAKMLPNNRKEKEMILANSAASSSKPTKISVKGKINSKGPNFSRKSILPRPPNWKNFLKYPSLIARIPIIWLTTTDVKARAIVKFKSVDVTRTKGMMPY